MKPLINVVFVLFTVISVTVTLGQTTDGEPQLDISVSLDAKTNERHGYNLTEKTASQEELEIVVELVNSIQPRALSYNRTPHVLTDKYIVTLNKLNWYAAYAFCEQNNWSLLQIETPLEQFEVQNYLNFFNLQGNDFWTSGNNFENPRRFCWQYEGPEFKFSNWAFGQPDNYKGGENCVKLFKNTLQWGDDFCENSYHFICQRYIRNNSVPPTAAPFYQHHT